MEQRQSNIGRGRVYRVAVIGSKSFDSAYPVWQKLYEVKRKLRRGDTLVVVHGTRRGGVDKWAHDWCQDQLRDARRSSDSPFILEEQHPPRTKLFRPRLWWRTDPLSNKPLVDSGADQAVAFPVGDSPRTRHTIVMLEEAGVPVDVVEPHHPQAGKAPLNTATFERIDKRWLQQRGDRDRDG